MAYPVLSEGRAYITIWGYFNGPDEMLAVEDGNYYTGHHSPPRLQAGINNHGVSMQAPE